MSSTSTSMTWKRRVSRIKQLQGSNVSKFPPGWGEWARQELIRRINNVYDHDEEAGDALMQRIRDRVAAMRAKEYSSYE